MSGERGHPKRKNPILRTRVPLLPAAGRSRVALGLTAAAAEGRFALQVCRDCKAVQYPPREACHRCLGLRLDWQRQSGDGELISETTLTHSHDEFFRQRLPWRLGMVRLDVGPIVVAHLHGKVAAAPARVRISARLDRSGQGVLIALPVEESTEMSEDKQLREMTCDPRSRKILITDVKTATGQALTRALLAAGAATVWGGYAEPWKKTAGVSELQALAGVTLVPLDLSNSESVRERAAELGAKIDILINTAELHRPYGISSRHGIESARAEMDINYFGLLRLAQEFGPVMRSRAADGLASATAWVNVLSIYSLANFPAHGTFSASKAAALSLSQCLRAQMQRAGVRVLNVFPGPIDDEWNQELPPPKLAPAALALAIVKGLQDGIEDLYPGDLAQEWLVRWRDNPKVLERELAAAG